MAYTESNMMPLGTTAPPFALPDTVSDKTLTINDISANAAATVVLFLCNHCPFVKHINAKLVAVARDYQQRGVAFVAISSNDAAAYPQDAPDLMKIVAHTEGYTFPYLYDATQAVARAYDAACTPDLYVFDENLKLVYRGRFDASRPKNDLPINGADLRDALDAILQGEIPQPQLPSAGCNIKWKVV